MQLGVGPHFLSHVAAEKEGTPPPQPPSVSHDYHTLTHRPWLCRFQCTSLAIRRLLTAPTEPKTPLSWYLALDQRKIIKVHFRIRSCPPDTYLSPSRIVSFKVSLTGWASRAHCPVSWIGEHSCVLYTTTTTKSTAATRAAIKQHSNTAAIVVREIVAGYIHG